MIARPASPRTGPHATRSAPGDPPGLTTPRLPLAILAALLALSVVLAYWPVAGHGFVSLDDGQYVTGNARVQAGLTSASIRWALTATHDANWFPLTWISHMLVVEAFGLAPAAHHLANLLLHAANTVLLFLVLARSSGKTTHSAVVAALFGLHPLHVESVAWVSARKDVLSALFWMLTTAAYVRYLRRPAWTRLLAALLLYAAGLMTKSMLVTLPFALLLLDFWPLGRFRRAGGRRAITLPLLEKLPFVALSAASSIVTFLVQRKGGAVHRFDQGGLTADVANALVSYTKYLALTVWPEGLAAYYPFSPALPGWQVAGAAALLLGASLLAVKSARRAPWVAVGWFWYVGTLVPVIGLVRIGEMALADRYTYLPLIGVFTAAVWGVSEALGPRQRQRALALAAAGLALLGAATWRQAGTWENSVVLMRHALAVTRDNWLFSNNLAAVLIDEGRLDEAHALVSEALRIKPGYTDACTNMGLLLARRGENAQAVAWYRKAIELDPDGKNVHVIKSNLGGVLIDLGRLDEARGLLEDAIRRAPEHAGSYKNMGALLVRRGADRRALWYYQRAVVLNPRDPEGYLDLGRTALAAADPGTARGAHRALLALAPEKARELQKFIAYYEQVR